MQWNHLVVNLWSKMSLFCSMKEGVSYLFLSAITYLLFCYVQPPPRSDVPHVCCRPSNGRKMQALTAVEWLTAVRYETDGRLANGWTDGLPENRLTGLGAGLPLTPTLLLTHCASTFVALVLKDLCITQQDSIGKALNTWSKMLPSFVVALVALNATIL